MSDNGSSYISTDLADWRVDKGWQERQMNADGTDDAVDDLGFVRAEIVHDYGVAGFERPLQRLAESMK